MINITVFFSMVCPFAHAGTKKRYNKTYLRIFVLISFLFFSYLLGVRDLTIGTDTERYASYYLSVSELSFSETLEFGRFEPLFSLSVWFFSSLGLNYEIYFTAVAAFMLYTLYKVAIFLTNSKFYGLLALMLFVSWPFYYSLSINVQRQAVAFGFMMLSFIAAGKSNNSLSIFLSLISTQFHIVGVISFIFVVANKEYMTVNRAFLVWILCVVVSVFELSKSFIFSSGYNRINIYEGFESVYKTGFRLDFFLFSIVPLIVHLGLKNQNLPLLIKSRYTFLLKSYILLNAIYFIFAFMPYSDRYIINSWMLIPFFMLFIIIKLNSSILLFLPMSVFASLFIVNSLGL
jgi:hypothetical protein